MLTIIQRASSASIANRDNLTRDQKRSDIHTQTVWGASSRFMFLHSDSTGDKIAKFAFNFFTAGTFVIGAMWADIMITQCSNAREHAADKKINTTYQAAINTSNPVSGLIDTTIPAILTGTTHPTVHQKTLDISELAPTRQPEDLRKAVIVDHFLQGDLHGMDIYINKEKKNQGDEEAIFLAVKAVIPDETQALQFLDLMNQGTSLKLVPKIQSDLNPRLSEGILTTLVSTGEHWGRASTQTGRPRVDVDLTAQTVLVTYTLYARDISTNKITPLTATISYDFPNQQATYSYDMTS